VGVAYFETWLTGMLSDPSGAPPAHWLARLQGDVGMAELLVLRETGLSLLRDGSVDATWRLLSLRDLVMLLAMGATGELGRWLSMI
jgi:hypothetical protein